jgi:hypothetical protein
MNIFKDSIVPVEMRISQIYDHNVFSPSLIVPMNYYFRILHRVKIRALFYEKVLEILL